jgi:hypothetical protein
MRSFASDQTLPPSAEPGFLGYLTTLLIAAALISFWVGMRAL